MGKERQCLVYDFDSLLNFPEPFDDYFRNSFKKEFDIYFRLVPIDHFLDYFASDRSHMIKKIINDLTIYHSKPPNYPCIKNKDNETNNLFDKYLNLGFK